MSEPIDVLVSEDVWGAAFEELATRYRVVREAGYWNDPALLTDAVRRSRALVVRNRTRVDRALLTAGERLTVVARAGVGLDNIDLPAADAAGVVVTAPLGANAVSVAEHTIGLALSLARGTVRLDAECRAGGWNRAPGRELRGGTWGLLGCGATARACGELAGALGMRVLAHDPFIDPAHPELARAGIELAPLEEVVAGADVLSCHLPATPDTTGLVNAGLLALMRPSALFVNVGRGEVVDEDALADALESGALGGAALDVRAGEPPEPGRLEKLDNVVLTPHIAGITAESQARIARNLAQDIDAVLSGGRARSAVGAAKEARS
ncbi:phosphoglycerate dehydrogenase [Prauserella sp. PE36]|uniref:Hydroxyacid dehydrogenase n=1 Tax=Prauserella endophytica TaxID=1592324 RepID=A0ABY2S3V5_9PSEU|nr:MULTISPECIES: hydroxyacid dehydrogenase [Prauserella]PXY25222.1 phosphoglycerate dehydrogenase [Prauserella coralliicola]RBM23404.1 phosphoglycerate dehydrogenase [Prauserella sp. PE36]TKG69268.1 hydroxyacid dehydrogenase [Prauserella endophytica]